MYVGIYSLRVLKSCGCCGAVASSRSGDFVAAGDELL